MCATKVGLNTSSSSSIQMDTKRNKMKSSNMDRVKSATIKPFENDDYDYLINCTDLITTCQVLFINVLIIVLENAIYSIFFFHSFFRKRYKKTISILNVINLIGQNRVI